MKDSYDQLLQMWRTEKKKRQEAEEEIEKLKATLARANRGPSVRQHGSSKGIGGFKKIHNWAWDKRWKKRAPETWIQGYNHS